MCHFHNACVSVTLYVSPSRCFTVMLCVTVTLRVSLSRVTLDVPVSRCVRHLTCLVLVLNGVREEGAVAVERFDPSERDGSARHVDDHQARGRLGGLCTQKKHAPLSHRRTDRNNEVRQPSHTQLTITPTAHHHTHTHSSPTHPQTQLTTTPTITAHHTHSSPSHPQFTITPKAHLHTHSSPSQP